MITPLNFDNIIFTLPLRFVNLLRSTPAGMSLPSDTLLVLGLPKQAVVAYRFRRTDFGPLLSSRHARLAAKASCRSGSAPPTGRAGSMIGSRSRTRTPAPCLLSLGSGTEVALAFSAPTLIITVPHHDAVIISGAGLMMDALALTIDVAFDRTTGRETFCVIRVGGRGSLCIIPVGRRPGSLCVVAAVCLEIVSLLVEHIKSLFKLCGSYRIPQND
jgi:hypothetical protein